MNVRRRSLYAGLLLTSASVFASATYSAVAPAKGACEGAQDEAQYIGSAKCGLCHSRSSTGDQLKIWKGRGHSRAYYTLGSEEAKKIAAERGIEDPQKSDECLRCHVTGHGLDESRFQRGFQERDGVQCETCHGPGSIHMMARTKAARSGGEGYPEIPPGEIIADVPTSTCLGCHNEESPTYKPFCPHERRATIRHLNPQKPRTPEELAALEACTCEADCICKSETDGVCRDEEG